MNHRRPRSSSRLSMLALFIRHTNRTSGSPRPMSRASLHPIAHAASSQQLMHIGRPLSRTCTTHALENHFGEWEPRRRWLFALPPLIPANAPLLALDERVRLGLRRLSVGAIFAQAPISVMGAGDHATPPPASATPSHRSRSRPHWGSRRENSRRSNPNCCGVPTPLRGR